MFFLQRLSASSAALQTTEAGFLYEQESYAIRGACFEVYKAMGPGFLEAVYQECLAKEFARQIFPFIVQQQLALQYKQELLVQS